MHDSYWTHAGTVDDMNRILREQFVDLHSRPLLQNLLEEFRTNPEYVHAPRKPRRSRANDLRKAGVAPDAPVGLGDVQPSWTLPEEPPVPPPRPIEFQDVPPLGDLDIDVVKDSRYFFA